MELIGLTGGVGSGKSTAARMLKEMGATVIDADEGARAVVEPGTPGFQRVVAAFGEGFVKDGRLDRAALAERVFRDDAARKQLNGIVHPLVREWMLERQQEAEQRGESRVILEIPLLYENGLEAGLSSVIVVAIPAEEQVRRLVEGQGYTEAHARARLAAQLPLEEKTRRATHIVDNRGDLDETRRKVERVWNEIQASDHAR